MCITLPGQIIRISDRNPEVAEVSVEGAVHRVNIGTLADEVLAPGDWILIHSGCAMAKLDPEEAKSALDFVKALNQSIEEELMIFAVEGEEEVPW